ncbi:Alpha/Beta hydrolase protein [Cladorrhinum sp. PSN332]|nr:Alpha/Beta hydrolase protein [Cladorrhinum sp. PSN332]
MMDKLRSRVPRLFPEKRPKPTLKSDQVNKMPTTSKGGLGDAPLYQPKDGKANVDIVFVHGIKGDRIDTWTWKDRDDPSNDILWPEKLLPGTFPKARIVSFGYNADFAKFFPETIAPELTIDDYSSQLLHALRVLREGEEKERPIIFVAHSMGGLVVANALSGKKSDEGQQSIVDHTIGVLFLGTPFQGSSLATYGAVAISILEYIMKTQPDSLETLEKKSKKLADINKEFAVFLKERDRAHGKPRLEIACFFEERPIWGKVFVVPKISATWLGVDPLSIDANHREMCRFDSEYSMGYKSIAGKLKQWIEEYDKNKKAGGVGGLNAQAINVSGDVNYSHAQFYQSIAMGNVVGTTENAVPIHLQITN